MAFGHSLGAHRRCKLKPGDACGRHQLRTRPNRPKQRRRLAGAGAPVKSSARRPALPTPQCTWPAPYKRTMCTHIPCTVFHNDTVHNDERKRQLPAASVSPACAPQHKARRQRKGSQASPVIEQSMQHHGAALQTNCGTTHLVHRSGPQSASTSADAKAAAAEANRDSNTTATLLHDAKRCLRDSRCKTHAQHETRTPRTSAGAAARRTK